MYSVVPCGCVSDRVKDIFLSQVSLLTVESEFNCELLIDDLSSIWKVEDLTGTLLDATKGCLLLKPVTERVLLLILKLKLIIKLNIQFDIELS